MTKRKTITYIIISVIIILAVLALEKRIVYTEVHNQVQKEMENFRNQNANANVNEWSRNYCESDITITDWNTDGKELAFMLSDGTELYATKSETVYNPERKQYISFDEISDIEKDSKGNLKIYSTDGNVYTVSTENANE